MDGDDYFLYWLTRKLMCLGTFLAMIESWESYHSVWWAILHGVLSWIYVIYRAVT
jgi:hypothetical protein